jgi:glycerol-3-phosphate acyltransferase PlsY
VVARYALGVPQDARLLLVMLLIAYFVGSIPVGYVMARARGIDIRKHGSGNIGATNVWRVMGWRIGATCFALDMLKGFVPALMATAFATRGFSTLPAPTLATLDAALLNLGPLAVGAAAMIGHIFPIWLGFRGGKGVATGFGALMGVWPVMTVAMIGALAVWLLAARLTRMVGISSVVAAAMTPVLVVFSPAIALGLRLFPAQTVHPGRNAAGIGDGVLVWPYVLLTTALAGMVIYKHRANIARTLKGTEPKIGLSRLSVRRLFGSNTTTT